MAVASKKRIFDNLYEVLAIVGRGSGSVVYHARHVSAPTSEVALKVLVDQKGETQNSDRLRKEALAMVSCRDPHVIRLDDFHSVGNLCYLCLEYAPESDLRKYVTKLGGTLGAAQAELFLLQAAQALKVIHKAGILHRDIKPDNILVVNHREIRICDFGIALLPGETSTLQELQEGVGTMSYMSPEILEGKEYDHRADIYALGVSMYEMLLGRHPFDSAPLMKQLEVRQDQNVPALAAIVPNLPGYLSDIIMKALRYNPEDRFESAKDLVASLEARTLIETKRAPAAPSAPIPPQNRGPVQIAPAAVSPFSESPEVSNSAEEAYSDTSPSDPFSTSPSASADSAANPLVSHAPVQDPSAINEDEWAQHPSSSEAAVQDPFAASPFGETSQPEEELGRGFSAPTFAHDSKKEVSEEPFINPFTEDHSATTSEAPAHDPQISNPFDAMGVEETVVLDPAAAHQYLSPEASEEVEPEQTATRRRASISTKAEEETFEGTEETQSAHSLRESIRLNQERQPAPRSRVRALALPVFIISAILMVVIVRGLASIPQGKKAPKKAITSEAPVEVITPVSEGESQSLLPLSSGTENLRFPELRSGIYSGTISKLIANDTLPLTILSYPSRKSLVVMIGIEGWTPRTISLDSVTTTDDGGNKLIRVASNGLILEFAGTLFEGTALSEEINGTFKNVVTGDTGSWRIAPIKAQ